MTLPLYQVDAFTDVMFQGNPAAVCPLPYWLPDGILQAIAEENNLSETAFYVERKPSGPTPRECPDYELRWFTPTTEVDLCGHATLAAAFVLFRSGTSSATTRVCFSSRSGPLHVTKAGDLLTLDFPSQPAVPCPIPPALIEALGRSPTSCFRSADYLAVYETEAEILELMPDYHRLRDLDLRGVIVTAPGQEVDFVSRFFAPKYGINEDPVTGSAHCALAPYWAQRLNQKTLSARQLSRRTGQLQCQIEGNRVLISGRAVLFLEGAIHLSTD